MRCFFCYSPSGEITSVAELQDSVGPPIATGGANWIEVPMGTDASAFWVSDGMLIAYSEAGADRRRSPPSTHHVWHPASESWVDARTLSEAKAEKNDAINAARLRANQSTFTFAGKQIAVDPLSRSDIDGAHGAWLITGGPPPGWPGGWKAVDNTIVPIPDMATWAAFYGTMVATGTANFNHAQLLKAQLAAATTIAEVESVPDW